MGYDLSATLGYGVKLKSYEGEDGLLDERPDLDEDLEEDLDSADFSLVYAGTDECTEIFLLVSEGIVRADWYGYAVDLDAIHEFSNTRVTMADWLAKNGVESTPEDYKWWLLPRWF
jgi:hypothetical protein